MIVFPCPSCAAKLGALEKNAGKSMPCPQCHQQITVPSSAPASSSAASVANAPTLVKAPAPEPSPEAIPEDEQLFADDPLAILAPPRKEGELGWLGSYPVLQILGHGGMGVVFLAEDPALGRRVAIKTLLPSLAASAAARKRFLREARAAAAVKHDHIVTIHHVGEHSGMPFLVMELLEGQPLSLLLETQSRLPNAEILRIGREMAEGLAAAHERGLIHRDVKPANVWLETRRGNSGRVKLLDFGLARPENASQNLTEAGVITGTPSFMAPELALGKPTDARSDLFSLGCVLYQMATGQLPFTGASGMEILLSVTRDEPRSPRELNANLHPRLAALIRSLLAKNRHDRPESARVVADTLAAIERDRETALPPPTPSLASDPGAAFRSKTSVVLGRKLNVNEPPPEPLYKTPPAAAEENAEENAEEPAPGKGRKRLSKRDFRRRVVIAAVATLVLSVVGFELLRRSRKGPETAPQKRETPRQTWQGPAPVQEIPIGTVHLPPRGRATKRTPPEYELRAARQGAAGAIPGLRDVFGDGRLRHWGPIHALAFSPDGKMLASASADQSIKLWDASTGRAVHTFAGHTGSVLGLAFSPDGRSLASASADGTIKVWKVDGNAEAETLSGHRGAVLSVAFNHDGSALASSGADRTIRIWEPLTGKAETLAELSGETRALAYSPDGKTLATGGRGDEVVLWDVASGKERSSLPGHLGGVLILAYAADDRLAVSQGRNAIKVWQVGTGKLLRQLPLDSPARSLVCSPDGRQLATSGADGSFLWDLAAGKKQWTLPIRGEEERVLALSRDGVLAIAGKDGVIQLWQTEGKIVPGTENPGRLTCVAFSADGQVLAFGGIEGQVRLWERTAPDLEPRTLKGPPGTVRAAAFSRDGRRLAWASGESVIVWDLAQGKVRHTLTANQGTVAAVAFSPSSDQLAAAAGAKVTVWDVASGSVGYTLSDFQGPVEALAFSADSKLLATGDRGAVVTLWDTTEQGKKIHTLVGHLKPVRALAFARDSKTLISADSAGNVRLWNTETGAATMSWERKHPISAIAFLNDGQVAAAACDGTVRFWDQTGEKEEVVPLGPGGGWIEQAAFSADGAYLATVNGDGTVYIIQHGPAASP